MFRSRESERIEEKKSESPGPQKPKAQNNSITHLAHGAGVTGALNTAGSLVVEGRIEGSVRAAGDVKIGTNGVVEAEIEGHDITVAGTVKGRIFAEGKVILLAGSRVEGDIHAQSLKIEDSVFFQGGCVMGDNARREHSATGAALPKSVTSKTATAKAA